MAKQINNARFTLLRPMLVKMLGIYFDKFNAYTVGNFYPGELLDSLLPAVERENKVEAIKVLRTAFQQQCWQFTVIVNVPLIRDCLADALAATSDDSPVWRVSYGERTVQMSASYKYFSLKEAKDFIDFLWEILQVSGCTEVVEVPQSLGDLLRAKLREDGSSY